VENLVTSPGNKLVLSPDDPLIGKPQRPQLPSVEKRAPCGWGLVYSVGGVSRRAQSVGAPAHLRLPPGQQVAWGMFRHGKGRRYGVTFRCRLTTWGCDVHFRGTEFGLRTTKKGAELSALRARQGITARSCGWATAVVPKVIQVGYGPNRKLKLQAELKVSSVIS
jgi:hypothetical protein